MGDHDNQLFLARLEIPADLLGPPPQVMEVLLIRIMPGHLPGARIQNGVGRSRRTSRWVVRRLGAAYIIRVATAVCSANSRTVELCSTTSWTIATRRPSRSAPSRTRWIVGVR